MENPKYKLSSRMSCNMRNSLKQKSKAGRHWETLVDFSLEQLEKRLRRTMPNGYTWQDFIDGKLHIDHKIPIAVFNYQTPDDLDFKKCWTLKNLQLLPAKENLIKSAKIDKPFQPSLLLSKRRTMLAEKISLHGI